jgi:hypothetical protein
MQHKTALLLGLALIVGAWMMWQFGGSAKDSLPPPAESGSPTARNGGIEPEVRERRPQSEPAVVPAPQNNLSKDALMALVVARLREWEDQDDSKLRDRRMQELDALLNGTNRLEIVQELPPDLMGYVFALPSLRQKLMSDPKAALDWMSSHTNVSGSQVLTLIHDWGQENREEMWRNLAGLPEGEWKQTVLTAASNEALSSDPAAAIVWAGQMSPGERQTGLMEMAAMDWVKRDPDAAAQWVGQVTNPALREQLVGALAVGYADIDPAQAAECAIQSVQPGAVLNRAVAEIAWVWAMREPAAAMAWVAQFPEGAARQMALGNVMNIWGNRDQAAALAWIEGLPEGLLQTEAATDLQAALPAAESSTP